MLWIPAVQCSETLEGVVHLYITLQSQIPKGFKVVVVVHLHINLVALFWLEQFSERRACVSVSCFH